MSSPWLSIVVPTIGRPTLRETLDSLDAQPAAGGTEVLVVADTFGGLTDHLRGAREHVLCDRDPSRYRWLEHDAGLHCVGQPQRQYGTAAATAGWVWCTQDDNVSASGALASIEAAIRAQHHPRPLFFRWLSPWRELIWRSHHLEMGNIDADCLVLPTDLAQQVTWGLHYAGDFDAARDAFNQSGGDVEWCSEVISIARPGEAERWWGRAA